MAFRKIALFAFVLLCSFNMMAQCVDPFALTVLTSPVCTGRDLQLSATNYPGAVYTWTGPPGSGFAGVFSSSPTITGTTLANGGVYTVTAVLPGGCTYTATVNVAIEVTPPKPTVIVNSSPACPKETVNLIANSGSPIGFTFYWSGPNWPGFSSSIVNTASVTNIQPNNSGTYSVYIENTAGCKSDVADFDILVHPLVTSSFINEIFLGCDKDSLQFTNTSTGAFFFDWDFGDATSSNLSDPLHTYLNQGKYKIRLITSNMFCKDTSEQIVTIDHKVKADFTVDDDSICQHNPIKFTNTSTYNPVILPAYLWDFKDGSTGNTLDISHIYDGEGTYKATLIATDYLGCKDTASHIIVVDSTGSINFTPSVTEICAGNTIAFKGTFMQIGNTGTIWEMGDGNTITNVPNINYTFDEAGTYNVKFTASYRICPSAVFSTPITIKPYPQINIGNDTSLCLNGKALILKDIINESNPAAKWKWNSPMAVGTSNPAALEVRHPGTYEATVEINGCEASDSVVVKNDCFINIPNAFSPNDDGNDDYFLPRQLLSKGVAKFKMSIYNRWGQLLFTTNTTDGRGWDGRFNNVVQPLGVYVYLIDVAFIDGRHENYQGNLTLLR